jgi:hypothetical protein
MIKSHDRDSPITTRKSLLTPGFSQVLLQQQTRKSCFNSFSSLPGCERKPLKRLARDVGLLGT